MFLRKNVLQFTWDRDKEKLNIEKHHLDFKTAQRAFYDPKRITTIDKGHSTEQETRYFCFGMVSDAIITVRFTYREENIRIIGAGYWRKGKKFYEKTNKI